MRLAAGICAVSLMVAASSVAVANTLQPHLRAVSSQGGFLKLTYTVGDLTPVDVQVASSPKTLPSGAFLRDRVELRERLAASAQSELIRWRTRRGLAPGTYYVHVSALQSDGVTSCQPPGRNCLLRWSNVIRVTVPK